MPRGFFWDWASVVVAAAADTDDDDDEGSVHPWKMFSLKPYYSMWYGSNIEAVFLLCYVDFRLHVFLDFDF
jgi:hypothetical protein